MKKSVKKLNKVKEVEKDLELVKAAQIQGGLFFEDRVGDAKVKLALKNRTLRVDDIINQNGSAIPPLLSRKSLRSTVVAVTGKKNISKNILHQIQQKSAVKKAAGLGIGSAKAAKKLKQQEKMLMIAKAKGGFDLWESGPVVKAKDPNNYLEPAMVRKVVKPKVESSRPFRIPAVVIAHPGNSYQPVEEDHLEAINVAASREFQKMEVSEKIAGDLSYPPELDFIVERDFFDSGSEESEDDGEGEKTNEDPASEAAAHLGSNGRKTRAEVNKKTRMKQTLMREMDLKQQKSLIKQINKVKELEKDLNKKKDADNQRKILRDQFKLLQLATKTRKLSRYNFKPADMEIKLSDEAVESLRSLKPEGNLIKDRFQSLQARNMIETRVPVKRKRRYKLKEVESHDYKRFK